ncbi:MAG TPA: NADH oxidase, partial [Treponema sp.]|nr:NADH oxidase [Treponema sp.]
MSYLLTPFDNGKIQLKNRLVMPPMATAKSDAEGRITLCVRIDV